MYTPPTEPTLDTPCVRNCCLGDDEICAGCGRHLQEILRWHGSSSVEREQILEQATARRQARNHCR